MECVDTEGLYACMGETFEDDSLEAIGMRLKLTRQVTGLQQNEFCERAGIAANAYNQYEKAKKRISLDNALALCKAYGLTLDWIYRGDPGGLRHETAEAIKSLYRARDLDHTTPGRH